MRDAFLDRRLEVHVDIRRTVAKLDGKVLRYIAHRPLRNRGLAQIEEPRTALASAGDFLLHPDYGQPTRLISSRTISISRRYGRFLYSLAAHQKCTRAIESGTGFRVSGLYILHSLRIKSGFLHTLEIASYAQYATESLASALNSFLSTKFPSLASAKSLIHENDLNLPLFIYRLVRAARAENRLGLREIRPDTTGNPSFERTLR